MHLDDSMARTTDSSLFLILLCMYSIWSSNRVIGPTLKYHIANTNGFFARLVYYVGFVFLHETTQITQFGGVIFKFNFEKSNDKVCWSVLQQAWWMKGFPFDLERAWVDNFVQKGSVSIEVNDDAEQFFNPGKGYVKGILYRILCLIQLIINPRISTSLLFSVAIKY